MQRTALIMFGALLISGSIVQMAAASEHHKGSKAYFGRDISEYRGSYNQIGPVNVTPPAFDRFHPSGPRNEGPLLNPPGG